MNYNSVFWVQLVSLIYVCISAPIYVFVMATLLVYRKKEPYFRNSFFVLWISLGVTDLCHAVIFWFSSKFPLMGFFPSYFLGAGKTAAIVMMVGVFVTHLNQVLGIGVLSLNRLTALVYPTNSEQFWYKKWLIPSCIFSTWAASTLLSVPVLFMDMEWKYSPNISKIAFHFLSADLSGQYMFWVGVLLATVAISIVFIYIFMFYIVTKMTIAQRKALHTQIKLAMCAFAVASFLALLAVSFCIFSFYPQDLLWGDNAALFFVSCDLNSFCNVYLLLATSKIVRKRVKMMAMRLFCCLKPSEMEQMSAVMRRSSRTALKVATTCDKDTTGHEQKPLLNSLTVSKL